MKKDFSEMHPFVASRQRGWIPVANPLEPQPPRRAYGHSIKHIYIQADQLLFDVDSVTSLIDKATRKTQEETEVTTSEADSHRPMFYRWFDQYIASVERILSAYVAKPEGVARMNGLKEWQEKEIILVMPDYWDATVYDALVQAIHKYVVDGALFEYLSNTLTSRDQRTIDRGKKLEDGEKVIKELSSRVLPGTIRKHLNPF